MKNFRYFFRGEVFGQALAIKDVTNDGIPDIVVGTGDINKKLKEYWVSTSQIQIFKYTGKKQGNRGLQFLEFKEVLNKRGNQQIWIQEGGFIDLPYGSQGLYNSVKWDGEKFIVIQE